jgi:hypothetical protein
MEFATGLPSSLLFYAAGWEGAECLASGQRFFQYNRAKIVPHQVISTEELDW